MTTLPLGVDLGHRRVRVALSARTRSGGPRLHAVAAHDHDGDPVAALKDALAELQTRERRCVLALAAPDAVLQIVDLPAMPPWERAAAARFEAAAFIDYPIAEAGVSIVQTAPGRWAIGVVRRAALAAAFACAKAAGLEPVAVDDMGLALRRAFPERDGIIDVGDDATRVTVFRDPIPYAVRLPVGGARLTDAIAQSLGLDRTLAEERKRHIGFGGAGEEPRDALLASLEAAFADARAGGCDSLRNVALCGNGSRVPGLDAAIERATGVAVHAASLPAACSDIIPPDVLRAAGADWCIAYGLSLWSIA